jgi:hypothetical protein
LKISNIIATTLITAWSGMACAGFVTTFGQTPNGSTGFPLSTYPQAASARNTFVSGVTASFYDFESATVDDITVTNRSLSISLGGVTATLSGGGRVASVDQVAPDLTDQGRFSVSGVSCPPSPIPKPPGCLNQGKNYWEATAPNGSTSSFKIDFSSAVDSFGFFGIDIGDFGGTVSMVLTRASDDTTFTVAPGAGALTGTPADGSVLFFGVRADIADDYFKSVQFIASGGSGADVFAFDMFTATAAPGTPVPLPGSLALVGAALGGLALVRRRR